MNRSRQHVGPVQLIIALLICMSVAGMSGCKAIAFLAYSLFPPKTNAFYHPQDRPTLVLVDDPADLLGFPGLTTELAHHVGTHLLDRDVVTTVVSPREMHELAERLGDEFVRTPIDRIGREVNAEQVVHIHVESISVGDEPGLYRPTATVRVKLIDAVDRVRLYPSPITASTSPLHRSYHSVTISLPYSTAKNGGKDELRAIGKQITEKLGLEVARLFYDYVPDEIGGG